MTTSAANKNSFSLTTLLRGEADTLLPVEKQFFLTHWGECMGGR